MHFRTIIIVSCIVNAVCAVIIFTQLPRVYKPKTIIDWNSPEFIGDRSREYQAIFAKASEKGKFSASDKEALESEVAEFKEARSNSELISLYGISFKEGTISDLAIKVNSKLFDVCSKYYMCTYGDKQAPSLIPMAIANVETPNRADQRTSYSALLPTKYIDVETPDAVDTMSCLTVLENQDTFKSLASDHWTRDRGALQMNPNYGVGNTLYDSLMGPSEATILANVGSIDRNMSMYSAYEPRNKRTIDVDTWLSNSSKQPGDRFNVRDSVLRLASASQDALDSYTSQYTIHNDMEVVALIAQHHGSSSIWDRSRAQKKSGNWRSGTVAHSYTLAVSSEEFQKKLKSICLENLQQARKSDRAIPMSMSRGTAKKLWNECAREEIVPDYSTFVVEGRYFEVTYLYPIQVMYAYSMLGLVYSGR